MKPCRRPVPEGEQRDQTLTARGDPEFFATAPEREAAY
jgi:hypothetical protein